MKNETYIRTLELSLFDICEILSLCSSAANYFPAGSRSAKMWARIHDEIEAQVEEADDTELTPVGVDETGKKIK